MRSGIGHPWPGRTRLPLALTALVLHGYLTPTNSTP